jgi:hypothetical protein
VQGIIDQNGAFEKQADSNKFVFVSSGSQWFLPGPVDFVFEEEADDGTQKSVS